jgi:hypothetical protein
MQNLGPFITGAAFWLFIGACAVAGIIADYKRRRLGIEVVRAAIEKGMALDPALIEKLTSREHGEDSKVDSTDLKLGGVITLAAGVGLCPVAWLLSQFMPVLFYPTLGLGVLAIFVAIGLLIGAGIVARAAERAEARASRP